MSFLSIQIFNLKFFLIFKLIRKQNMILISMKLKSSLASVLFVNCFFIIVSFLSENLLVKYIF
jgi:hypothetical protein